MIVIFCRISTKASLNDLLAFAVSGSSSWNPFSKAPEVSSCEILEVCNEETGEQEFHGLVKFQRAKDAEAAIKRLNGRKLMGKHVTVREYLHRSPGDQRVKPKTQGLNRPEERRREDLQVIERSKGPSTKAYKGFSQQHGD